MSARMVIPLRDDNPTQRRAVVTLLLIAANVLVFVAYEPTAFRTANQTEFAARSEKIFLVQHAAVPCEVTHGRPLSIKLIQDCEGAALAQANDQPAFPHKNVYLAVIVSMFLHASWLHLLGNMLFLWIFGNNVEDRLGPVVYLAFYVVVGVAAAVAHILTQPDAITPVLGASGAIAGVMGAYLVWFPRARILTIMPVFLFWFVNLPAYVVLLLWFVFQFFTNPNTGVAWVAHVGGFVFGVLYSLTRPQSAPRRSPARAR